MTIRSSALAAGEIAISIFCAFVFLLAFSIFFLVTLAVLVICMPFMAVSSVPKRLAY